MDLHRYYAENKDDINSSIMEIASDLAVGRMVDKYKQPFEAFVEPDDLDDPDSGTHYKEEFQDEYNQFYDEEYERVASLMQFDIGTEDGIRRDGTDDPISSLVSRANAWQQEARELGLYMQKYCGCVFSEEDRYAKQISRDMQAPEKHL